MSRTFSRGRSEDPGERLAEAVGRLGRRPDRRAVGADVRHAAGRAERSVGLDRPPVRGPEGLDAGAGRPERRQVALLRHVLVADDLRRADRVGEREVVGQPRARRPLGPERARGAHRVPLPLGDDAEEAADPHDPRAGNRGDRRLVDRLEGRAERRRADRAAVEHAGKREVLDVEVAAGDLRRHVRARDGLADVTEGARRLERRLGVDREPELAVTDQLAVGHARAARLRADDAVGDREVSDWVPEPLGGEREQRPARGGRRAPELLAAAGDAGAAAGPALVGAHGGVALDQLRDPLDVDVELLGHHLPHRGPATGPEIHLAGEHGDGAIGVDGEEGVDLVGRDGLAEVAIRRPAGSRARRPAPPPGEAPGRPGRARRPGRHRRRETRDA